MFIVVVLYEALAGPFNFYLACSALHIGHVECVLNHVARLAASKRWKHDVMATSVSSVKASIEIGHDSFLAIASRFILAITNPGITAFVGRGDILTAFATATAGRATIRVVCPPVRGEQIWWNIL